MSDKYLGNVVINNCSVYGVLYDFCTDQPSYTFFICTCDTPIEAYYVQHQLINTVRKANPCYSSGNAGQRSLLVSPNNLPRINTITEAR